MWSRFGDFSLLLTVFLFFPVCLGLLWALWERETILISEFWLCNKLRVFAYLVIFIVFSILLVSIKCDFGLLTSLTSFPLSCVLLSLGSCLGLIVFAGRRLSACNVDFSIWPSTIECL